MKTYHFKIENDTYPWPTQYITGADVRGVGPGIPEDMDLFIKRKNSPSVLVADTDKFDLDEHGIEKFYAQDASSEAGGL